MMVTPTKVAPTTLPVEPLIAPPAKAVTIPSAETSRSVLVRDLQLTLEAWEAIDPEDLIIRWRVELYNSNIIKIQASIPRLKGYCIFYLNKLEDRWELDSTRFGGEAIVLCRDDFSPQGEDLQSRDQSLVLRMFKELKKVTTDNLNTRILSSE